MELNSAPQEADRLASGPSDWVQIPMGDFVSLQRGHDLTWRDRQEGQIPVMGAGGQNGWHSLSMAQGPGVILGRSGASFGQAHFCEDNYWPHNTALYVTDFKGNDPSFVFYYFRAFDFSRYNSGGAQQSLNRNFIAPIQIAIPLPDEQRAIATALSDIDALLDGLDRLIAKKRDIKQAAMQGLLSPPATIEVNSEESKVESEDGRSATYPLSTIHFQRNIRLPGFEGDWEYIQIGENIDLLTGFPFPSAQYSESGIRLLRGSNIKRGETDWSDDLVQYWPEISLAIKKFELAKGDIVIAMDGSLVGRSFAQLSDSDLPAILLQRVARIRSNSIDMCYLKECVCSEYFTAHCDAVKTVTAIPHISPIDIRSFQIALPPSKEEQSAIASILLDMGAEIEALKQRRAKTRDLKQAMMQELLTGRTRLVEN